MSPCSRLLVGLAAAACDLGVAGAQGLSGTTPASQGRTTVYTADEPAQAGKEGKILYAHRVTLAPPTIDGALNDEAWQLAERAGNFVQWEPDNDTPMSEATEVQVAYDDANLYVAVRCFDRTPEAISVGLGRRDDFPPSDLVAIGFDPRHDHLTGYSFQTNPSGVQGDHFLFDDESSDRDYDMVWDVRSAVTAEGWMAEFRIPFSQMRFTPLAAPGQVWGFSIRRDIRRRGEYGEWVGRPRGERGAVSRWGHLVFDAPLITTRRLELLPYALARSERLAAGEDGEFSAAAGVDLRLGIGQQATLAATVNPDFGQVEQDPAVLNLSVFETFFPERRPFFLEDSRTFIPPYGLLQVFHSRRIGRRPDRFALADDEDEIDRPDQTTIVGAAKLTGKGSRWTYGALTAVTAPEHAVVGPADTDPARDATGAMPGRRDRLVEPLTSYTVARLQRDVLAGTSNVGAIVTSVVRDRDDDAFAGGFDFNVRRDRNRFTWNGHWVATRAPGDDGVKTGFGGVSNVFMNRKHVRFNVHADHFSPDFRVTDLGFFRARADRTLIEGSLGVEQPDPWKVFRRIGYNIGGGNAWNGDGLVFTRFLNQNTSFQLRNFWGAFAQVGHNFQTLDDLDTRGGPPIVNPASTYTFFDVYSDTRKSWRFSVNGEAAVNDAGGWNRRIGPMLRVQPSGRLQLSLSTNYTAGLDAAQWISNTDTDGDGAEDHVYGTLRRNVIDITLRSTYALSRDLTFQFYLQPFVAAGDYRDIRRLARPSSFEFEPATLTDDPDFNRKSLRGNAVLRWEYLRGSTLFVVWNLSTSDTARPGTFSPFRDLGDTFTADGTHVFMVKLSYWLNR
jgi:hypothetical protein